MNHVLSVMDASYVVLSLFNAGLRAERRNLAVSVTEALKIEPRSNCSWVDFLLFGSEQQNCNSAGGTITYGNARDP